MAKGNNGEVTIGLDVNCDFRSVLDAMNAERVFCYVMGDGCRRIAFEDGCDECFGLSLDKRELLMMIAELKAIAEIMVE